MAKVRQNMKRFALCKNITLLFFASLVLLPMKAQDAMQVHTDWALTSFTSTHTTDLPKSLVRKFKRDAARLALRMDAQQEDLSYQNILISKDLVENFYQILSNIYVNDEMAQSLAKCNIHTFPNPSIDHFKIIFDSNASWATPLQNGITETDSPVINDLLDEYDLILENHEKWTDSEDIIVVRSKEPLNIAALANEFQNIEGVVEIDLGIPEVGGNDIIIKRQSDGWQVDYVLKFGGTYIPGKGKQHTWSYKASDDGSIQFISDTGDAIPSYMKCSAKN